MWFGWNYSPLWRRKLQPTPVLLPGKSHGWRSLVGCRPCGQEESDTTERLHFHFSLSCIGEGNGNPLPVFLPGESQGRGSLVGCHLWARTESDMTEATQQQQQQQQQSSAYSRVGFLNLGTIGIFRLENSSSCVIIL